MKTHNELDPSTKPMHSLDLEFPKEWIRLDNLARDAGFNGIKQACNQLNYWSVTAGEFEEFMSFSIASSEFARGFAEEHEE